MQSKIDDKEEKLRASEEQNTMFSKFYEILHYKIFFFSLINIHKKKK